MRNLLNANIQHVMRNLLGAIGLFIIVVVGSSLTQKIDVPSQYPDDCLDSLNIPESFTPNGDSYNDAFAIYFPCPPEEFEINIFNRWGEEVFMSLDHQFKWYAEYKGSQLPSGVYFWTMTYTFNGAEIKRNGDLTIIR